MEIFSGGFLKALRLHLRFAIINIKPSTNIQERSFAMLEAGKDLGQS